VTIPVAIVTALFSRFFQLTAPLLGLAAVFAVMPLGVPQRVFSFVDALFALLVAVAVKRINFSDAAEHEARRDQCSEYSGLPKSAIQNNTSKSYACILPC
jgi:hypothetical protein